MSQKSILSLCNVIENADLSFWTILGRFKGYYTFQDDPKNSGADDLNNDLRGHIRLCELRIYLKPM